MASFVAQPGAWSARSTARLQPSGWAARSAKLLAALLMSQRLMCDVDMVEEQQLRQLEGDAAGCAGSFAPPHSFRAKYRLRQVFAHGAFTHTTAVQLIESGFFMRMIVRA